MLRADEPLSHPTWILAHIDVETIGLVPGYHEIVDIGIVYTALDANTLQKFRQRALPLGPQHAEPGAEPMNGV